MAGDWSDIEGAEIHLPLLELNNRSIATLVNGQ